MTIVLPFVFANGPGHIADGTQVNANFNTLITAIEGISTASTATDVYQTGVLAGTDWTPGATNINSATGELELTVFGGAAWLPAPVSGLVRTFTANATYKLKPPVLPGPAAFINVGIELTASGAAATVSNVSGAEQVSEALAIANPPAVSSGKIRVDNIIILNTAGVYSVVKSIDRRSQALGKVAELPYVSRSASFTAQNGELIEIVGGAGAIVATLPAVTLGPPITVFDNTGNTVTITATGGAKIYGGFIEGVTSITLTRYQFVRLLPTGANWFIVAGEPKNESKYTALKTFTKAEAEAEVETSGTRPAQVAIYNKAVGQATLFAGGTELKALAVNEGHEFRLNAGQKWKANQIVEEQHILL